MKRTLWIGAVLFLSMLFLGTGSMNADTDPEVEAILTGIETKYRSTTYTAAFHQTSTLKAMELTDTARGKIYIQTPGAMRWEYEAPDPQTVITNGAQLWVHRLLDNQVMVGKAPTFFAEGKGAGFLSDIGQVRNSFSISQIASEGPETFRLQLIPKEKRADLSEVHLTIDKHSFEISHVRTFNPDGDDTRIQFSNSVFGKGLDPGLFQFTIPAGADIVQIDE